MQIVCVYDSKTGIYAQPNFMPTVQSAQRMWPEAALDPNTQIGKYPSDFTLFHVGTYDDETAKFTNLPAPVSLGTALEAKTAHMRNQTRVSNAEKEITE